MTHHHVPGRKSGLCAALLLLIASWFSPAQAQTVISTSDVTITAAQSPYTNSITFDSTTASAPGALILNIAAGNITLNTGTVTLNRDSSIYTSGDSSSYSVYLNQNISFADQTTLTIGKGTTSDVANIEITGNMVTADGETGSLTINRNSASTVTINGNNSDFEGEIFVSSGSLAIDNYQALNENIQLTLASGTYMEVTDNVATTNTVVVEGLQNSGSIDLNSHTLQINSTALALGTISDGTLVLKGRTIIDSDTNLNNVDIELNNGTLVINKSLELNQDGTGTVEIGNGQILTVTDDYTFNKSAGITYQATALATTGAVRGTLFLYGDSESNFETTSTTSKFTTTTANLINLQVGVGNTWTAGNNDTVFDLTLDSSTTDIADGGTVVLKASTNTLTINGELTMGKNSEIQTNGGAVTLAGGSVVLAGTGANISGSGSFSLSAATTFSGDGDLTLSKLGIGANALTIAPSTSGAVTVTVSSLLDSSSTFSGAITVNENGKLVLPTFTTSGAITLNKNAEMQAGEITTTKNVTLAEGATLTSSDDLNVSSTGSTTSSPAAAVTIASGATIDAKNVLISGTATLAGLGTIDGNLGFTSSGTHTISGGKFTVTGTAEYKAGANIALDFASGTGASLKTSETLTFNSDSTTAITTSTTNYKTYGYSTVTLSGTYTGDSVTLFETGGIYGSGADGASAMTSNVSLVTLDTAGNYLVQSGDTLYFKIINSGTGFSIDDVNFASGTLTLSLTAKPTTNNPIEQIIINGVNNNEQAFITINDAINADGVNKTDALNQLNPQMASAIINSNFWAAQEYASMSLQRTKMARFAMRSQTLGGASPEAYMAATNPEVAFLAQSCSSCDGAAYANPYGNPYYGAGCLLPGCGGCGRNWWFRGYGGWQIEDADRDLYGYEASLAGFSIGVDKYYSPNFLLGFSAGGMWTDITGDDPGDASAKGTSFLMDIYGSLFDESRHLDFMFGYQSSNNETDRGFNYALDPTKGEFDSDTFFGGFEVGKTYHYLRSSYELFYGIQYINMQNGGYEETGSVAALKVDDNSHNAVLQSLGFRCMRTMYAPLAGYTVVPQLEVAWVHDYKDGEIITSSSFAADESMGTFTTVGYNVPRDRCKVALGLDFIFCTQAKFDFKYEVQAGSGFGFHVLTGGLNYQF